MRISRTIVSIPAVMFLALSSVKSAYAEDFSSLAGETIEIQIGFSNSGGGARFWNALYPLLREYLPETRLRPRFNDRANGARAASAVVNDTTETIMIGFVRPPEILHATLFGPSEADFDFGLARWIAGVEQESFIMFARSDLPSDPASLRTFAGDLFLPVSDIEATHATAGIMLSALTGIHAEIVVGFNSGARRANLIAGDVAFYTVARDPGISALIDEGLAQELYSIVEAGGTGPENSIALGDFLLPDAPQVAVDFVRATRGMGRAFFAEPSISEEHLIALQSLFRVILESSAFASAAQQQGVPFQYVPADVIATAAAAISGLSPEDVEIVSRVYQCGLAMSAIPTHQCDY